MRTRASFLAMAVVMVVTLGGAVAYGSAAAPVSVPCSLSGQAFTCTMPLVTTTKTTTVTSRTTVTGPTTTVTVTQPATSTTTTSTTSTTTTTPVALPGSWSLAWSDEFDGTALDLTKWNPNYCFGRSMNGVSISSGNVTVSGGVASLRLSSSTVGAMIMSGTADNCPAPSAGYLLPVGGAVEFRAKFPLTGAQCANWPAVWTSGNNWPTNGEADIAEVLDTPERLTANYHSSSTTTNTSVYHGTAAQCGGWHTFGLIRGDAALSFWWDGVQVGPVDKGVVVPTPRTDAGGGQALIANIGKGYADATDPAGTLQLDYVRAYQPA